MCKGRQRYSTVVAAGAVINATVFSFVQGQSGSPAGESDYFLIGIFFIHIWTKFVFKKSK